MQTLKAVTGAVLALIALAAVVAGLVFGGPWLQLQVMRIFGTEFESVKTDIYRNNKSYVEGTIRDLRELRADYVKATPSQQDALRSLILHRAGELDWDRLPADLREFLEELQ